MANITGTKKAFFARMNSALFAPLTVAMTMAITIAGCQQYDITVMPNKPTPATPTTTNPNTPVTDDPTDPPVQEANEDGTMVLKFGDDTVSSNDGYTYDFGNVRLGTAAPAKVLEISNTGKGTLSIAASLPLSQVTADGVTSKQLAPGERTQIKVTLKAGALTPPTTGIIKITSSDPSRPSVKITMSSRIVSSKIELTIDGSVKDLGSAITYDFGNLRKDSMVNATVQVKNLGTGSLNASFVKNLSHFVADAGAPIVLPQDGAITFNVRPKTTDVGEFSETFVVNSDDPDHGAIAVTLKAKVSISQLIVKIADLQVVSGDTVDFGTTYQGKTSVVKTATLVSGGGFPLTVSNITLPAGFRFQTAPALPMAIGLIGGTPRTFNIVQDTTTLGDFDDAMEITSNDSIAPSFKVKLHSSIQVEPRYGEIAVFDVSTATAAELQDGQSAVVPFANALEGAAEPSKKFMIKNLGNGNLTVTDLKVPDGFYVVNKPAAATVIAAKIGTTVSSFQFEVRRKTASSGIATGQLEIDSNDVDEAAFNFTVTGIVSKIPFVCNPFGGANGSNQILAQIYSGNKTQDGAVANFFVKNSNGVETLKLNALLCFNNFDFPERDFSQGFGTDSNTYLMKPGTNEKLVEWFAVKTASNLKLGNATAGYYQLATVSDDGSRVSINNEWVVANDGSHSQQMRCSTKAFDLNDPSTRLPIRLDYYQGPIPEIALVLLWRKVDLANPSTLNDSLCTANSFRKSSETYNAMLGRGWQPVPATSFELSSDLLDRLK